MLERIPYDRRAAVAYAHQWAYGRNPDFYDYDQLLGSQNDMATIRLFITRQTPSPGPFGISTTLSELEPGDFVQFRFNKDVFGHTPVVVEIGRPATLQNTLIAAHSYDADWRPLSTYYFQEIRFLHIQGAYREIRGEEVLPSM